MQIGANGVALLAPLTFLEFLLFHNYFDWSSSACLIVLATNPAKFIAAAVFYLPSLLLLLQLAVDIFYFSAFSA